jgi:putative transposase
MPWKETCPMDEKVKFIATWLSGEYAMAQLCRGFGVSRKTGYKRIERYLLEGVAGLEDRSRAPHTHPHALPQAIVSELLAAKRAHPQWGPRLVRDWLRLNHVPQAWPAVSTIGELYRRCQLVRPRRRRARAPVNQAPLRACTAPNEVWSADFKGPFRLGTGRWCYPLTVSDNASRYLLACRGLRAPTERAVWPHFEWAFRHYGLPTVIRTDNGAPFASTALSGLTRLAIGWIKLGIIPERIAPGRPDQNGRHERMHRTLKEATATPPKANAQAQQCAFNRFRTEYNQERPHQALAGKPPGHYYRPSPRAFPTRLPEVTYGPSYLVRRVRHNGEIKLGGNKLYVSETLRGEPVGLQRIDDGRWELYFSHVLLGLIDERLGKVISFN